MKDTIENMRYFKIEKKAKENTFVVNEIGQWTWLTLKFSIAYHFLSLGVLYWPFITAS